MDIFDIIYRTGYNGRQAALALQGMGLRAVIAPEGLRLVSENVAPLTGRLSASLTDQPRDEFGQFVRYWVLALELANDLTDIEAEYSTEAWWEDAPGEW